MRLTYVTTIPGTQEAFLRGQNRFMAERGFELHAVASPGPPLEKLAARDGVMPHAVPMSRAITPVRDLVALVRLVVVLRRIRPDILHVSTPKAALLGAIAGWIVQVPVRIFLVRGLITENTRGLKRRFFRWLEWLTARLCHASLCVAPSLLVFARDEGILRPNEGIVAANGMSNGVDVGRFDPERVTTSELCGRNDEIVIGFVGRLTRDKGLEELAAAWKILRKRYVNLRILLVGRWEEYDAVSPEIRRHLESDRDVVFTGFVDDVRPYYKEMNIFVFPSHGTEGFPNAPMEAAAMELPVVATRVVGCVDAVQDGKTGILVPPQDAESLAAAIGQYLDDPSLCRQHGKAGRERVLRDFQQQVIWEALYNEYVLLTEARKVTGTKIHPKKANTASAFPRNMYRILKRLITSGRRRASN